VTALPSRERFHRNPQRSSFVRFPRWRDLRHSRFGSDFDGLPGGAPPLLPRSNIIQRSSFIAP
jgi:hypothetical protein